MASDIESPWGFAARLRGAGVTAVAAALLERDVAIRAATIEECARVCDERAATYDHWIRSNYNEDKEHIARFEQREMEASTIAAAIRALKEKP